MEFSFRPYAPIALFTYSRSDHARQAVASLLQNAEAKKSDLFVFSDGPKTDSKRKAVDETRRYIHTITGFRSVTIIERETNWGLANSLISGITEVINLYGRVIVVEDDLVLSPYFLQYMNEGLEKYKDDERVSSIAAFVNPVDTEIPSFFFLRYFSCWGWATWKRGWDLFEPDTRKLLKKMRWKVNDFNIGGAGGFYGMLYCQKVGLVDSWAVRFYASQFLAGKLQLFPSRPLAVQSGMDGSGTHSEKNDIYDRMRLCDSPVVFKDIPVEENQNMYLAYSRFYKQYNEQSSLCRWIGRLKSFVRRLLGIDYR